MKSILALFFALFLVIAGCAQTTAQSTGKETVTVPKSVLDEYQEVSNLSASDPNFRTMLRLCKNNDQLVYVVDTSGSFSGSASYYSKDGMLIGRYTATDTNQSGMQFDLTHYTCEELKKSK